MGRKRLLRRMRRRPHTEDGLKQETPAADESGASRAENRGDSLMVTFAENTGANPEGLATRIARENLRRLDEQYKVLVNETLELVHGATQAPTSLIAELSEAHRVPRNQVAEVLSDLVVANIVELSPLGVVKLRQSD